MWIPHHSCMLNCSGRESSKSFNFHERWCLLLGYTFMINNFLGKKPTPYNSVQKGASKLRPSICFYEFNLKIYYSSPNKRLVSHYKHVHANVANRTIEYFDWENVLFNRNVNKQVPFFNNSSEYQ